ncbi:MAG TPA: PEGA domain-containing protein [candidate division Zixibacteria bacterium]|jgi:hypothetical protein|nr:PEGA domain-containing protein [candidate division Zixibacteria bacterium]
MVIKMIQRLITLIVSLNFLTVDVLAQNAVTYRLLITSSPGQAEVFLDGNRVGITPFSARLAAGGYQVRVSKEGYNLWEQHVQLREGQRLTATLTLRRKNRSLSWLWGVLALTVIGAATAGIVSVIKKQTGNSSGSSGPELPGSPPAPP